MGNYSIRRDGLLTAQQKLVADLTFQGKNLDEIAKALYFPVTEPTEKDMKNAIQRIRRIQKLPQFIEYYKSILTEWTVHHTGKALNKLAQQIDSDLPWLANKAANDILQRSAPLFESEDANTITVRVEGMPELGSPDAGEA